MAHSTHTLRTCTLSSFALGRPTYPGVLCFGCSRRLAASCAQFFVVKAGAPAVPLCVRCRRLSCFAGVVR